MKNSQVEVGSKWSAEKNFESATDVDGKKLLWKDIENKVEIIGTVNTEKIGVYEVTFKYNKVEQLVKVEVVEKKVPVLLDLKELKVKDLTLKMGENFDPVSLFESAEKKDGTFVKWSDIAESIKIENKVNMKKTGVYDVVFTYDKLIATSKVTVLENEPIEVVELNVFNSVIQLGNKWMPSMNFDSIIMSNGVKLLWEDVSKDIVIVGDVDTAKKGEYPVTYTYGGKKETIIVTVSELEVVKVQEVSVKDTNLPLGVEWNAKDNFNYVLMSDGIKRSWSEVEKDIKVTGEVKSNIPGIYEVKYTYGDKSAVAKITVKEMEVLKVQEIVVKNSTITVGDTWVAKDNFDYVMMSNGVKLNWKDVEKEIKIDGNVDTAKVGSYKITYQYGDKSAVATITVNPAKKIIAPVKPEKKLPQTGEEKSVGVAMLGGMLLILSLSIVLHKMKRKVE